MQWQEICDNPLFKNLPFRFETDRWGKVGHESSDQSTFTLSRSN